MKLAKILTPLALGTALGLAFAGPASATGCPGGKVWSAAGGSQVIDSHTVKLKDGKTSVEAENLDLTVPYGTAVSFKPILGPGVTCVGGAPRAFVKVGDTYYNSFDGNEDQCGGTDGIVSFVIPAAGKITHAGLVFDNSQQGTVVIKNLKVGGKLVDFRACTPVATQSPTATPTATPSATATPTATATATPSGTATPSATVTPSATGTPSTTPTPGGGVATTSINPEPVGNNTGALPVTGTSLWGVVAGGVALLAVGMGLLVWAWRRRDASFEA